MTLVPAAQDPVPGSVGSLPYLDGRSGEPFRASYVDAGSFVEFGDGVVVVGDEQPRSEVTGGCDMPVPIRHCPGDRVASGFSDDHPAPVSIRLDRLVD
jgi:hypothetical protein